MKIKNPTTLLDALEISEKHNLKLCFSESKYGSKRTYNTGRITDNQPNHLIAGSEDILYLDQNQSLNAEILLDIPRDQLISGNYKLSNMEVELYKIGLDSSIIQVIQKQGDVFEIYNFRIQPSVIKQDTYDMILDSRGEILEDEYFENYFREEGTEFGRVNFLFKCDFDKMFFKELCYNILRVESDESTKIEYNYNTINYQSTSNNILGYLYSFTSLKVYLELLQAKGYLNVHPDTIDNLKCFMSTEYSGALSFRKLKDINIINTLDLEKDSYPIKLHMNINSSQPLNISQKFNQFLYSPMISKDNNKIRLSYAFQAVERQIDTQPSNLTSRLTIAECSFILPNKDIKQEDIQDIHNKVYYNHIEYLKTKWDAISIKANQLFKTTPLENNFLSIQFINKYFLTLTQDHYQINTNYQKELDRIPKIFEDFYEPYESFFGKNHILDYIGRLQTSECEMLTYTNARIEQFSYTFKHLIRDKPISISDYNFGYIYPNSGLLEFRGATTRIKNHKYKIIINDTGNKTSWRPKIKKVIEDTSKKKGYTRFIFLEPKDKIDLMVLRRLFKDTRHVSLMSNMIKDVVIVKTPKLSINKNISYFDSLSFQGRKKLTVFTERPSEVKLSNILYIEYISSKNEIKLEGKSYDIETFSFKKWNKILETYRGKTLRLINKKVFNTLKENDDFVSFDEFLTSSESNLFFENLERDYVLLETKKEEHDFYRLISFFENNIFYDINRTSFKNEKIKIWLTIQNNFPEYIRKVLFKITSTFLSGPSKYNSLYGKTSIIRRLGADALLFDKIHRLEKYDLVSLSISRFSNTLENVHSRTNTRLFRFDALENTFFDLLSYSNTQNLDISNKTSPELIELRNIHILPYIYKWMHIIKTFKEKDII